MIFLFTLFVTVNLVSGYEDLQGTVIMVSGLFRHGNRTLATSYPSDPYYKVKYWPRGFGELTEAGALLEYNLGKWLRKKYPNLISQTYNADEVSVIATNFSRTIQSAKFNLEGLFGCREDIPIDFSSQKAEILDNSIEVFGDACPKYDVLLKNFATNPFYLNLVSSYYNTLDKISRATGVNITQMDFSTLQVYSGLLDESMAGLRLPDWTWDVFPQPLTTIAGYVFSFTSFTSEMAKLTIGSFVKEIIDSMNAKISGNSQKKLNVYFAHDVTIADFLQGLKIFNFLPPPFGAAVLLELREFCGHYFVQVLYKNSTVEEPYVLTLPGCVPLCPFDAFKQILQPILSEGKADCELKE